jgi:hypothetical protein
MADLPKYFKGVSRQALQHMDHDAVFHCCPSGITGSYVIRSLIAFEVVIVAIFKVSFY